MAPRGSQTLLSNTFSIFCYPWLYHFVSMGIGSHMTPRGPVQNTHLPSFHQVARELGYSYTDSSHSLAKGGSYGGIHAPALLAGHVHRQATGERNPDATPPVA